MEICPSCDKPAHFEITEVFPELRGLQASVRETSPDNDAIRLAGRAEGEVPGAQAKGGEDVRVIGQDLVPRHREVVSCSKNQRVPQSCLCG
jgi:hypothetical protein